MSNVVCNRADCLRCIKKDCIWRPRTNADRIRAMSDEELAVWIERTIRSECPVERECAKTCEDRWLEWLREEATE